MKHLESCRPGKLEEEVRALKGTELLLGDAVLKLTVRKGTFWVGHGKPSSCVTSTNTKCCLSSEFARGLSPPPALSPLSPPVSAVILGPPRREAAVLGPQGWGWGGRELGGRRLRAAPRA